MKHMRLFQQLIAPVIGAFIWLLPVKSLASLVGHQQSQSHLKNTYLDRMINYRPRVAPGVKTPVGMGLKFYKDGVVSGYCGGGIIRKEPVKGNTQLCDVVFVTAAHCSESGQFDSVTLPYLGTLNRRSVQISDISEYLRQADGGLTRDITVGYGPKPSRFDILLMKIRTYCAKIPDHTVSQVAPLPPNGIVKTDKAFMYRRNNVDSLHAPNSGRWVEGKFIQRYDADEIEFSVDRGYGVRKGDSGGIITNERGEVIGVLSLSSDEKNPDGYNNSFVFDSTGLFKIHKTFAKWFGDSEGTSPQNTGKRFTQADPSNTARVGGAFSAAASHNTQSEGQPLFLPEPGDNGSTEENSSPPIEGETPASSGGQGALVQQGDITYEGFDAVIGRNGKFMGKNADGKWDLLKTVNNAEGALLVDSQGRTLPKKTEAHALSLYKKHINNPKFQQHRPLVANVLKYYSKPRNYPPGSQVFKNSSTGTLSFNSGTAQGGSRRGLPHLEQLSPGTGNSPQRFSSRYPQGLPGLGAQQESFRSSHGGPPPQYTPRGGSMGQPGPQASFAPRVPHFTPRGRGGSFPLIPGPGGQKMSAVVPPGGYAGQGYKRFGRPPIYQAYNPLGNSSERIANDPHLQPGVGKCINCHQSKNLSNPVLLNPQSLKQRIPLMSKDRLNEMIRMSKSTPHALNENEIKAIQDHANGKGRHTGTLADQAKNARAVNACYTSPQARQQYISSLPKLDTDSSPTARLLDESLKNQRIIPYNRSTVPLAWNTAHQSPSHEDKEQPARIMNPTPMSATNPDMMQKMGYHSDGAREFPWQKTAGTDFSPNTSNDKYIIPPPGGGPIAKMVSRTKRSHGHYFGTSRDIGIIPQPGWIFASGTTFVENIRVRGLVVEIRSRTKMPDGSWKMDVKKPVENAQEYKEIIIKLCKSDHAPAGCRQMTPDMYHLLDPSNANVKDIRQYVNSSNFKTRRNPLSLNSSALEATMSQAMVHVLPEIPADINEWILRNVPFKSVFGKPWIPAKNGKPAGWAPTTMSSFGIVPQYYFGSHIPMTQEGCSKCHDSAGRHVDQFEPDPSKGQMLAHLPTDLRRPRTWYNHIPGDDHILSWHPYHPEAVKRSMEITPAVINSCLTQNGMVK